MKCEQVISDERFLLIFVTHNRRIRSTRNVGVIIKRMEDKTGC